MTRFVFRNVWLAIKLIAEQPITAELFDGSFTDDTLDALILAARAHENDDGPLGNEIKRPRRRGMVGLSHWGMFEFYVPDLALGEVFFMPFYVDFMWDRL